jgi:hypothetical protein
VLCATHLLGKPQQAVIWNKKEERDKYSNYSGNPRAKSVYQNQTKEEDK